MDEFIKLESLLTIVRGIALFKLSDVNADSSVGLYQKEGQDLMKQLKLLYGISEEELEEILKDCTQKLPHEKLIQLVAKLEYRAYMITGT